MKRRLLATALLIWAVVVSLWPIMNGKVLERQASLAAEQFVQRQERPYAELYAAMQSYNERIYQEYQAGLCDPWAYEESSFDLREYGVEDDIIGVLRIPSMDLTMPVYLGASYDHMSRGLAHLSQTSLPIGGKNTNCVIAGHRGWEGADYFRYLDSVQVGDTVDLDNLWETLHYRVAEIAVIPPHAIDRILIQSDRDLLTLLTCHPYASGGKQRLVVYCERVTEER